MNADVRGLNQKPLIAGLISALIRGKSAVDGSVGIQAKPLKMLDSKFKDRQQSEAQSAQKRHQLKNLCLKPQPPA